MDARDSILLEQMILAAVSYAEGFQHLPAGFYSSCEDGHDMTANTERGVIMLATHYWETRDSSAGGIWAESAKASEQSVNVINMLFRLDRDWKV